MHAFPFHSGTLSICLKQSLLSQLPLSELCQSWRAIDCAHTEASRALHTSTHCCLSVSTSPQSLTLLFGGNQWKSRKHNEVRSSTEEAISHILLMPSNYQSSTSTACHHHYWFSSASSLLPFPWSLYGPLVVRTESVTQWQATGCNGIKRVVKYTHTHTLGAEEAGKCKDTLSPSHFLWLHSMSHRPPLSTLI